MFKFKKSFMILFLLCANSVDVKALNEISEISLKSNSSPLNISFREPLSRDFNVTYTKESLVSCNPKLKDVVFKIENNKQNIVVIPQNFFSSSTKYSCKIEDLPLIYSFDFTTKPFNLKSAKLFAKEALVRLEFNDFVDIKSLKENLSIYKKIKLSKTKLQYKVLEKRKNVVLLEILEPIENAQIEISISSSLKSESGSKLNDSTSSISKILNPFNSQNRENSTPSLDSTIKETKVYDAPRFIPHRKNYALRIYLSEDFFNKIENFLEIDGVKKFNVIDSDFIYSDKNLSGKSLYYVDILSDDFKPNRSYKVTIKKGLKNSFRELKKDFSFVVKSGDIPSFVYFLKDKPYLSSAGDIAFSTVNISNLTLRVEKLIPENYNYFILFEDGDRDYFGKFSKEIFAKDIKINNKKNSKTIYKFHIKDFIKEDTGIYKIVLNYKYKSFEKSASKIVFVSDIGINAKIGNDQAFVSLFSLKTGKPIDGAKVRIFSNKNDILGEAVSSKDGTATINLKDLILKNPKAIIVEKGKEKNFLLLNNSLNHLSLKKLKVQKYRAYIYPQSDIVRPASKINGLIILKDKRLKSSPDLPIRVEFVRYSDDFIIKKRNLLAKDGVAEFNLQLSNYDRTGVYFIKVFLGKSLIGKKLINVESFIPPKIETNLQTQNICSGDEVLEVNVSSKYLFGANASNLEGDIRFKAVKGEYRDSKFQDYIFSKSSNDENGDILLIDRYSAINLNDMGRASVSFPCNLDNSYSYKDRLKASILDGTVGVTIMDGNQPVSKYKKVKIFPHSEIVGLKLSKQIFDKDENIELWSIVLNPKENRTLNRNLIVEVIKKSWFNSFDSANGAYKWDLKKEKVDSFKIKSGEKVTYKISEEGDYQFRVIEPLSGANGVIDFEISGWGYSSFPKGSDPRRISINVEPKEYKKGDNLKVSVKSPVIKGSLLVTMESDRVLWHKLYSLEKGSASLNIPIEIDLGSGIQLGALAVRATDMNESIIPFRAFGYQGVKGNMRDKKIKVSLDFNKTVKSNSKVDIRIQTDRDAKLLVSVVDVGILNITEQKPPNPFKFFTPVPKVSMVMFDIYDMVMGFVVEGNLISFGAGFDDELAKRKKHTPPEDNRVKPFMVWSNLINSVNKEANFTINVPEFNGKARVSVIAVNRDAVGSKSEDLTIKDDVIIKPSFPKYLLAGDILNSSLKVFNTTDKNISCKLKIDNSSNLNISQKSFDLNLKPKEQKELNLTIKALKEGKGFYKFYIAEQNYKRDINITTYSPFSLKSFIRKGSLGEGGVKEFNIPDEFTGGKIALTVSDNVLGEFRDDLKYLVSYPYGCAEQTSSKIGALKWSKPFFKDDKLSKKAELFIKEGMVKLRNLLNEDGEFYYWLDGESIEPYSSVYSSDIVLELDKNSSIFLVKDKDLIKESLNEIASLKNKSYNNLLACYSSYILSREKSVKPGILNMLYENKICDKSKISTLFLSSAYMESGEKELAKELFNKADISLKKLLYERDKNSPFNSEKWKFLVASWLKAKYFKLSSEEFNLLQRESKRLYSTQDKALAIRAISTHLNSHQKIEPMEANLTLNSKSRILKSPKTFIEDLNSTKLSIEAKKGLVSFSIDAYKNLPKDIKNSISKNSDFGIKREFLKESGEVIKSLNEFVVGEEIYAKIILMNRPEIKNVMIDMRVPSCFSMINSRLESYQNRFNNYNIEFEYRDIRDDRVLLSTNLNEVVKNKRVTPNYHIFYIPLRVTTVGKCMLPAVIAESMYNEKFRDYAKEGDSITVNREAPTPKIKLNDNDEVIKLVKKYYQLEGETAPEYKFINLFKYPIKDFFGKKNLTHINLMNRISNYNEEWPEREYKIESIELKKVSDEKWLATVNFRFKISKGKRVSKGKTTQYLKVIKSGESSYKIESIDVKMERL